MCLSLSNNNSNIFEMVESADQRSLRESYQASQRESKRSSNDSQQSTAKDYFQ